MCTARNMAELLAELTTDYLGYERYGAQGQAIGAAVALSLAADHAGQVAAVHLPGILAFPPKDQPLTKKGEEFLSSQEHWGRVEGAYSHQQGTYPQTLAYGLTDSPAGLAAWLIEKFRTWSDCQGDVERSFTRDELLTNLTIYWATGTINSSFLFYYDSQRDPDS